MTWGSPMTYKLLMAAEGLGFTKRVMERNNTSPSFLRPIISEIPKKCVRWPRLDWFVTFESHSACDVQIPMILDEIPSLCAILDPQSWPYQV